MRPCWLLRADDLEEIRKSVLSTTAPPSWTSPFTVFVSVAQIRWLVHEAVLPNPAAGGGQLTASSTLCGMPAHKVLISAHIRGQSSATLRPASHGHGCPEAQTAVLLRLPEWQACRPCHPRLCSVVQGFQLKLECSLHRAAQAWRFCLATL